MPRMIRTGGLRVTLLQFRISIPRLLRHSGHQLHRNLWMMTCCSLGPFNIHKTNTVLLSVQQPGMAFNMAATVSVQAGLELFNPSDIQMNLASSSKSPIIFDTRANLAITGNKQDFLPDIYKEVSALKLGGMAAGAKIVWIGNIAWTFPCTNEDQLAIITQCYLVPSATTRLLSPQQIFNKQNGNPGKFWGDEDTFYLEYQDKQPLWLITHQLVTYPLNMPLLRHQMLHRHKSI